MNRRGFALIIIPAVIVMILILGGVWYYKTYQSPALPKSPTPAPTPILIGAEAQKFFTYQGKLIHPFCVDLGQMMDPDNPNKPISLQKCAASTSTVQIDHGSYSADYPSDPEFPGVSTGYSMYKVLAKKGNRFLLQITTSGGGSGIFSSIDWLALNGSDLTYLDSISGEGDRCNNGVDYGEVKNNVLSFSINATPADIVELAASGTVGFHDQGHVLIEPYKDLEASAASCFATLNYHYDLTSETSTLDTVTLRQSDPTQKADEGSEWTNQYTYQSCFNKLYNSYIDQGKTELSIDELKTFVQQFFKQCQVK